MEMPMWNLFLAVIGIDDFADQRMTDDVLVFKLHEVDDLMHKGLHELKLESAPRRFCELMCIEVYAI